jgi:hypothetical protein
VINRTDAEHDRVETGRAVGGVRTLSGVIAHESTHLLERVHFGQVKSLGFPAWKFEGYADYVAQEGSLSDADAAKLRREGRDHPALVYYDGRKRVEAALKGGETVDQLFLGK